MTLHMAVAMAWSPSGGNSPTKLVDPGDLVPDVRCILLAIGAQHRSLATRIAHDLCSSSVTYALREPAGLPS